MKLFNIGPDDFFDYELEYLDDYDWFVYYYENDGYHGHGEGVGYKDGFLYFYCLGHCSCYGPLEGFPEKVALEVVLNSPDVLEKDFVYSEVKKKVLELI